MFSGYLEVLLAKFHYRTSSNLGDYSGHTYIHTDTQTDRQTDVVKTEGPIEFFGLFFLDFFIDKRSNKVQQMLFSFFFFLRNTKTKTFYS